MNSSLAQQAISGTCCCGTWNQIFFPNFDFEDGPDPPPGGFIVYGTGAVFGGWTVTRATIDHCDGNHANLGAGNPNGASNFVDLHGSPGFGAINYKLNGLKIGASYRLEFWTAQNGGNHSSTGTVKVAGGAWLNQSWTVTISGSVFWFKVTGTFIAMATMADLEFSSVGDLAYAGTLIDDISLFECPGDVEAPKIADEPMNAEYNCIEDVPAPSTLDISDDCDLNPTTKYSQNIIKNNECEQTITRKWEVSDHCGNSKIITQEIKVFDQEAPKITKPGSTKYVECYNYNKAAFTNWLLTHGGAVATDNCKEVFWEYSYDKLPQFGCDTTTVTFSAKDNCGNETLLYLDYILTDTIKPRLVSPAIHVLLNCSKSAKDSLRSWLDLHGHAEAKDSCSAITWKNNFNGDSSALKIKVDFIAIDQCGNKLIIPGLFEQIDSPDTNYLISYNCNSKKDRIDTSYFTLPGCDSVVINHIIGIQSDTTFVNATTCDASKVFEIQNFTNSRSCDSILYIQYNYHKPDTNIIFEIKCGIPDTIINQQIFSGSYCDSLIITMLIPGKEYSQTINKFSCDSAQLGTKILNFQTVNGCDSIINIITSFAALSISNQDSLVCGLAKSFVDTLRFTSGSCDSIHIIQYKPIPKDSILINLNTCDPLQSGIKIDHYLNQFNCDSIIVKQYNYTSIPIITVQKETCNPLQKPLDTLIFNSSKGCDSLVIQQYIIHKLDTQIINRTTCDPNQNLLETKYFKGQYCDSVLMIQYKFQPSITEFFQHRTCKKDLARIDTSKYTSQQLCDSIVINQFEYFPITLSLSKKDISCYHFDDGEFEISSLMNTISPYEIFFDGKSYSNKLVFTNISKGIHDLIIKDKDGCTSDSLSFEIEEPSELKIDIGPDIEISNSTIISFSEKSNKIFNSYAWFPTGIFSCSNCPNPTGRLDRDTTVYLIVEDQNGCIASDTLNIKIKSSGNFYVPNAFSPNGDQINDHFYVSGSDQFKIDWISIYDRWGNLVFNKIAPQINKESDGWDGTYKSQVLNPAVFVYVFSIRDEEGNKQIIKGDLSLIR